MMSNKIRTHQITEVSHVVQVRAEGPEAPSPGQRPGYMMILTTSPCKGKSFI